MSRYASVVGFPFTSGVSPINFDSFTVDNTTINENNVAGNTVIATVQTNNIKTDFALYWTTTDITGTLTGSHFVDGVESGTFFVDGTGKATITRTAKADSITNGNRQFKLQIRLGSITGGLMIATDTITINDTSLSPIIATKNASLPTNIVQVVNVASNTWNLFSSITGGLGSGYNYTPSPTLPAGLSVNTGGQLVGTPTATSTTKAYTVTVNQTPAITGQTAVPSSITFNMAVASTLAANYNIPAGTRYLPPNVLITPFIPVVAAGGWTPYTYALSGNTLPAGLSFNTATGQITGTPTLLTGEAAKTYTVTIQDSATSKQTKTNTFVAQLVTPITTSVLISSRIFAIGTAIVSYKPVQGTGGSPILTYSASLPTGLTINSSTGIISGTPSGAATTLSTNVTVTDQCLPTQSSSKPTSIQIVTAMTLSVPTTPTLTEGVAFTAFTPVVATGGTTNKTYSISPALPNGLVFNTTTGQIEAGTPTTTFVRSVTTHTVRVLDGCTVAQDQSTTFTLTIRAIAQVTFSGSVGSTPTATTWVVPAGVTSISAVVVGGGGGGGTGRPSTFSSNSFSSPSGASGGSGGGGGLSYRNNIAVTPGQTLYIFVGQGGTAGTTQAGFSGGNTLIHTTNSNNPATALVSATGGTRGDYPAISVQFNGQVYTSQNGPNLAIGGTGGAPVVGTGFAGGKGGDGYMPQVSFDTRNGGSGYTYYATNATGGGGAGGYAGVGGNGGNGDGAFKFSNGTIGSDPSTVSASAGAGGAGGGGYENNANTTQAGGKGGGVMLLGQGTNGAAGTAASPNGGTGSLVTGGTPYGAGGSGGGGYTGSTGIGTAGGVGGVRIMWPGTTRAYPSTGVADQFF